MTIYTKIDDITTQRDDGLIIKKSPFKEWSLYTEFLSNGGVPKELNKPDPWVEIRSKRNVLLRNSDYNVLSDIQAAMTKEQQESWFEYRKNLRDLPQKYAKADHVVWPVEPK